ncbi:MAG: TonB-dependent receptor [Saprospiraceae bacterium]|nr:TonB-dependent receptor [Saprospiraceae bacterium]
MTLRKYFIYCTYYLILVSTFLVSNIAFAQTSTGVFKGLVKDRNDQFVLIGVIVKMDSHYAVTDENGRFELTLPAGSYSCELSLVGYVPVVVNVNIKMDSFSEMTFDMEMADNILKTTTVTSGRYDKAIGEVTVSLEVIRPQLVNSTNTTALDQVLQKMPGVDIIDGQANIRGGSGYSYGAGSRVLILLDDIPALQADAGTTNWNDFPIENISRIEILKGASSVLYGSSALNGIINVLTGYPTEKAETKAVLYYTHFMDPADPAKKWWTRAPYETGMSILHKQKFNKLDVVLNGFYRNRESFNQSSYSKYGRLSANLKYRLKDNLIIGLNSNFNPGSSSDFFYWRDAQTGAYQPAPDVLTISNRFRFNLDPYLTYFDKAGSRHKIIGRYNFIDNRNNDNRSNRSDLYYAEYQYLKTFKAIDLVLASGVVYQGTATTAELYGDTTYRSTNLAAYLQLEKKFFNRLNISLGARVEYNEMRSPEMVGDFVIPGGVNQQTRPVMRAGANYQLANYTFIRAAFGQGYRFPTVAERFVNTPFGSVRVFPNPALESETGWTAEIGFKQGLQIGNWKGFFDIAGFVQEYDNMMEFVFTVTPDFQFGFQSQNIGDTRIRGLDMNISGAGKIAGLETIILTGYTYLDPRYRTFTEQDSFTSSAKRNILKYRFQHTFKFDLETGTDKIRAGISVNYNSNMENIDAILEELVVPGLKAYRAENNKGFIIVDFRASWKFTRNLKASVLLKNALNREYSLRPGLLEGPRNLTFRLDVDI